MQLLCKVTTKWAGPELKTVGGHLITPQNDAQEGRKCRAPFYDAVRRPPHACVWQLFPTGSQRLSGRLFCGELPLLQKRGI